MNISHSEIEALKPFSQRVRHMTNIEPQFDLNHSRQAIYDNIIFSQSELQGGSWNEVTADDLGPHNLRFENQIPSPTDGDSEKDHHRTKHGTVSSNLRSIIWPAFAITFPIALVSAALLSIIFINQIRAIPSIFQGSSTYFGTQKQPYILVDFSATQIVFLASFLSTIAPLLSGCIMSLTTVLVCSDLRKDSQHSRFSLLPTPYQMSLLAGVLSASYDHLYTTIKYMVTGGRKPNLSPALRYASLIFMLSISLALTVAITDGALHYLSTTINLELFSSPSSSSYDFGRGVNALCSNFDRTTLNYGFPCTQDVSDNEWHDDHFFEEQLEIQYILHNISSTNEIRHTRLNSYGQTDIALLIPRSSSIPRNLDFEASTIGISSQCQLISASDCNLTSWGPRQNGEIYTSFNCSSNFWGVLGMNPNVAELNAYRSPSPYISFLATKPQARLQYGFFSDVELEVVYNPAGLNDSAVPDPNLVPLKNSDLKNPIYMAFAWRTSYSALAGDMQHEMATSPSVAHFNSSSGDWIEYFVNCELKSYNVSYVWFNNTLELIKVSPQQDGSLLNMWQGSINAGGELNIGQSNLEDFDLQSTIAGSTIASYEEKFSQLISEPALAVIGGYGSNSTVIQQQLRRSVLVAKIPTGPLCALLVSSLTYPILGLFLLYKASRVSLDRQLIAPLFSYQGLAAAAWCGSDEAKRSQTCPGEKLITTDSSSDLRLYVDGDAEKGFRFGIWKRSQDGTVVEVQRSQTDVPTFI